MTFLETEWEAVLTLQLQIAVKTLRTVTKDGKFRVLPSSGAGPILRHGRTVLAGPTAEGHLTTWIHAFIAGYRHAAQVTQMQANGGTTKGGAK